MAKNKKKNVASRLKKQEGLRQELVLALAALILPSPTSPSSFSLQRNFVYDSSAKELDEGLVLLDNHALHNKQGVTMAAIATSLGNMLVLIPAPKSWLRQRQLLRTRGKKKMFLFSYCLRKPPPKARMFSLLFLPKQSGGSKVREYSGSMVVKFDPQDGHAMNGKWKDLFFFQW
ncbi:hypothetical protein OIU78_002492 [Salix suchowensis]|nr:hypothetical protein OIU78_002492 [Salix suchowensis]